MNPPDLTTDSAFLGLVPGDEPGRFDFTVQNHLARQDGRLYGGTAVAVPDEEILTEVADLAAAEGAWICPEGAACLAAARRLREAGWIGEGERVVVLNTGSGLKYPETVTADVPLLDRAGRIPAPRR